MLIAQFILEKDGGITFQAEIAETLRCKPDYVRSELGRLVALGMLTPLPQQPGSRKVEYMRTESPLWEIISIALRRSEG